MQKIINVKLENICSPWKKNLKSNRTFYTDEGPEYKPKTNKHRAHYFQLFMMPLHIFTIIQYF